MKTRLVIYQMQTNTTLRATQNYFYTVEIRNIALLTQLLPDLGTEIICCSHYSHNKEVQNV